jgi:hypothetical protein
MLAECSWALLMLFSMDKKKARGDSLPSRFISVLFHLQGACHQKKRGSAEKCEKLAYNRE